MDVLSKLIKFVLTLNIFVSIYCEGKHRLDIVIAYNEFLNLNYSRLS